MSGRALSDFVAEATEVVEALSQDLLDLDAKRGLEPDPDKVNALFRSAHTLKGMAGMFGHGQLAKLGHQTEELLDAVRLGRAPLSDSALEVLIETVDVFHALLDDAAKETKAFDARADWQIERLKQLATDSVGGDSASVIDPKLKAVFTEYEEHRFNENLKKGRGLFKVQVRFALDDFDQKLAALNAALKPLGEVISTLPSPVAGAPDSIGFELIYGSERPQLELAGLLNPFSGSLSSLSHAAPALKVVESRAAVPEGSLRSLTQTVRVDIGRLDGLMNAVGELILVRGNIQRLVESARQAVGAQAVPKPLSQALARETRALERRLEELQKGILEVRMVPLGQVFDKLARLLRRLVKESGKEISFEVSGGDVELDKLIVEELSDPLMHLLRNAIDHGIEPQVARETAGKPKRGTVRLLARQQGNQVLIDVADDGAGLDEARIRQVALQRGIVSEAQVAQMERRELLNLVFLPGFSTRGTVSEVSGRGVGLDVVKTNLARLSGIIDIGSERGLGTTFTLTLPLTLAIIRALVVTAGQRTYAVPLNSVLEIVAVKESELKTVERREVFSLRGQTLPFVRLARLFRLPERGLPSHFVVVVGLAQQRFGLAVDGLFGQQDIVTKPLGGRLKQVPGIAGATDLGDRKAVLVLDVAALLAELLRPS